VLAAVIGCGYGDAADPLPATYTVRDSAGIRIVENSRAAYPPGEGWRLSAEPVVRMGVVHGDPAYEFSGIVGLTRLSDGRIVVLDEQTTELRFYAPDGSFIHKVGRAGEGPGEFDAPGGLQRLAGDTLQVTDFLTRIRYAPDGTLAEQIVVDWMQVKEHGDFFLECGGAPHFVDDFIIGCADTEPWRPATPSPTGLPRGARPYISIPISMERVYELAKLPVGGVKLVMDDGQLSSLGPVWFAAGAFSFGGTPTRFVAAPDPDAYTFEVRGLDGTLRAVVRRLDGMRPPEPIEVEPHPVEQASPRLVALYRQRGPDYDDLTPPDSVPLLRSLFVDAGHRVWAGVADPSLGAGSWYDLFDADGRYLGPVRFPDRFRIFEIGPDYVLGVRRDELDVEFVELYRLIAPG
jgi:hypothetical protein